MGRHLPDIRHPSSLRGCHEDLARSRFPRAGLATSAAARDWKVRDVSVEPGNADPGLTLAVSKKAGIRLVRPAQQTTLVTIDSKDVVALWYDDRYVDRSLGREWWARIDETCQQVCGSGDAATFLLALAVGGAGCLVAEPFSEQQHVVNIRYRRTGRQGTMRFSSSDASSRSVGSRTQGCELDDRALLA